MIGSTLSHYQIESELGRGGMGIVYRAQDTKLDRTVAIKVLPSAALASDDDRARFYREAKAAAQLHHPHIASIFEIDESSADGGESHPFIVMEFIEGETLDARIQKGPLKLDEAVRIAGEIASGLEAAHEKGIVHRDIKSANVMLTAKGSAKILDFGLAQTAHSTKLTRMGSTLGTVAYMSPEQARGEEVDHRTDIWALGAVLHEMIAGRNAFPGDYEQAVVYSILNEDPEPLTALRADVPMAIDWIVSKCLAKKADARYQSVNELIVDLKNVDLSGSARSRISQATTTLRPAEAASASSKFDLKTLVRPLPLVLGLVLLLVGYGVSMITRSDVGWERAVRKFTMTIPGIKRFEDPDISDDGRYVVFQGTDADGRAGIFMYDFETQALRYFDGTFTGGQPRLSPDQKRIVYSQNSGGIVLIEVSEGKSIPVDLNTKSQVAQWWDSQTIMFTREKKFLKVSLGNLGNPVVIAKVDSASAFRGFFGANRIADTNSMFMTVWVLVDGEIQSDLYVVDFDSGEFQLLEADACCANYMDAGYVQYLQSSTGRLLTGTVMTRPFSLAQMNFEGLPSIVASEISYYSLDTGRDGTHVQVSRDVAAVYNTSVYWFDPESREQSVVERRIPVTKFSISPDGERVVYQDGNTIVVSGLETASKFTVSDLEKAFNPVWTPEGSRIFFAEKTSESYRIVSVPGTGGSEPKLELDHADLPTLSADGRWMYFNSTDGKKFHGTVINRSTGDIVWQDTTGAQYGFGSFSSDGKYLALSFRDGDAELKVVSLENPQSWTIDGTEGAGHPKWAMGSEALYYIGKDTQTLWKQGVRLGERFESLGAPEKLLSFPLVFNYDVSPKDGRILYSGWGLRDASSEDVQINVIFNWDVELAEKENN
ncbi:serine/threonine-protein kinase [bacterium]|nr:serine/threonine-protein kinase [bacterium]